MKITHIAFDADDTLWRNEDNFVSIGSKFQQALGSNQDEAKTRLYELEEKNLEFFGYGAKGFILSMIETALEFAGDQRSPELIKQILAWGKEMISHQVDLLPGVLRTIQELKPDFFLLMITKGDLFEQESKIARSNLADEFGMIKIVSEKDEASYRKILEELKIEPAEFLMVGNSLRSDIAPVVRIGGKAIHIPYDKTWIRELLAEEEKKKNRLL